MGTLITEQGTGQVWPQRRSKLSTADEAIARLVPDGAVVGLGGWTFWNTPMELVRAVVRARRAGLHLVSSPGAIGPELLLAAGVVDQITTPFVTMEQFGLAPAFRRAASRGELVVHEVDGPALAAGLRAAADDLPFGLIHDTGTDLPRVNPGTYRPVADPFGGSMRLFAVPALRADVAFVHAQRGDVHGNLQFYGATYFDQLLARSATTVVASVDEIVPTEVIRQAPHLTKVPGMLVTAIVEAGANPCGSHGRYEPDLEELRRYAEAAASEEGAAAYVAPLLASAAVTK